MSPQPHYGSFGKDDDENLDVELLTAPHVGDVYATNDDDDDTYDANSGGGDGSSSRRRGGCRNRVATYALAVSAIAAFVLVARRSIWSVDDRSSSSSSSSSSPDVVSGGGGGVPTPPALSALDPASDLGFRVAIRTDDALPSMAWGEHRAMSSEGGGGGGKFTPLPTNQWYLVSGNEYNLLSHRAASDPSAVGEVAHVYTIPYVLGVSPPKAIVFPKYESDSSTSQQTMAGIQLFMPIMKTGDTNMQMVFDRNNGISLGAVVDVDGIGVSYDTDDGVSSSATSYVVDPDESINPLGVSLKWNHVNMRSHVVRGMPYGTVRFGKDEGGGYVLPTILAGNRVISILIDSDDVNNDGLTEEEEEETSSSSSSSSKKMMCGSFTGEHVEQDPKNHPAAIAYDGKADVYHVKRELVLHMDQSDFTWIVFFSRPVRVQCYSDSIPLVSSPGDISDLQFRLNVVEVSDGDGIASEGDELVVRMALLNECTTGRSIIKEHCDVLSTLGYETISSEDTSKEYMKVLREGAMLYPKSPLVGTQFPDKEEEGDGEGDGRVTNVVFDWDVTPVDSRGRAVGSSSLRAASSNVGLIDRFGMSKSEDDAFIMFALPHHLDYLSTKNDSGDVNSLCLHTFHGRTCLVRGSVWNMPVSHGKPQSFIADRPPAADAIPMIAKALSEEIKYKISDNMLRGAADTYFPAKILAKMGRLIEIKEELQRLKLDGENFSNYSDADDIAIAEAVSAAADVSLPSDEEVDHLLDNLQQSVEIWLNPGGKEKGGAEAEFLYDASWGGFVNCGCKYVFAKGHEGEGTCSNTFPKCPALADVNQNFGNGWYNDHHFHYGYHIYAAAIVAKHRPEWARKYNDRILLYIRDIANPSAEDKNFPMFRQKDWYLGNSWAGGLMSSKLLRMDVFVGDEDKVDSARLVRNVGELLTAMEVSAANRFWHVWGSKIGDENSTNVSSFDSEISHMNTYPAEYHRPVVGMMYDTMASFQVRDIVDSGGVTGNSRMLDHNDRRFFLSSLLASPLLGVTPAFAVKGAAEYDLEYYMRDLLYFVDPVYRPNPKDFFPNERLYQFTITRK
ncbi:hypothetical protein ACHAXA_000075 [Cyclostephanos tholiformis]|uniref:glucan endo-1,3-beta-D-glucosidase n=1 Tax=Cyclostephanos tholiformis TaxID=382380 RepID=A0ABD3SRK6_9STRA